jgi:monofunctional biosynthetic peptidoglycan transglycosylase
MIHQLKIMQIIDYFNIHFTFNPLDKLYFNNHPLYDFIEPITKTVIKKNNIFIDYVSDKFCLAVITSEDVKFIEHYGFDFEQIKKSIERKLKRGKKLRGASTISQQTAKNLFFTPKRSWIRKVPEVFITLSIELLWTKKRILEVYINIIEMGNGIYGVEAAAQEYFHKPASKLSSRESALIAACLPNPRRWNAGKPSSYINRKAQVIQRFMHNIGNLPWQD